MRRVIAELINRHEMFFVCGESADGSDLEQHFAAGNPEVAVVDLSLPEESGFAIIQRLRRLSPALPILILSMHNEKFFHDSARAAGANGYLMKHFAGEKLHGALERIWRGETYFSAE